MTVRGTVDFVYSGSRVKVLLPSENCVLQVTLSQVKHFPSVVRPTIRTLSAVFDADLNPLSNATHLLSNRSVAPCPPEGHLHPQVRLESESPSQTRRGSSQGSISCTDRLGGIRFDPAIGEGLPLVALPVLHHSTITLCVGRGVY